MIPTKYPKVFFFFWLLLFLTEALISIFHILCLPIDSPNSVEATLEILLSRAKGKKQMSGHFYGNQSFLLLPPHGPTPYNMPLWQCQQHLQIKQLSQTRGASLVWNKHSSSLWSIFTLQAHVSCVQEALLAQGPLPAETTRFKGTGLNSISLYDMQKRAAQ